MLGMASSAVWYELRKNSRKGKPYDADYAQLRAYTRRKYSRAQGKTIAMDASLQKVVNAYLLDEQSPEHIAQRIKRYRKDLRPISGTAIRRYIRSPYGRKIEAHRSKIFKKRRHRRKKAVIDGRRMISERPRYINARTHIGDAEGDFIVSGKGGSGIILNVTDRRSRAPFFEKIYPVSIQAVERAIARIKKRFPELRSLTLDNDILFIHHQRLEKKFKIKVYFCYPGRPYEKGSNENRNKIVRQYIPKGSDISRIPRSRFKVLEEKLQRRIMKCLNYRMPKEIIEQYRKRKTSRQARGVWRK